MKKIDFEQFGYYAQYAVAIALERMGIDKETANEIFDTMYHVMHDYDSFDKIFDEGLQSKRNIREN
ncbi:hypothetical protein P4S83_07630 [Aneurinibacillus thermoaerophilus]|uniref:hypothetical protein n=1 Tax=Aneurinibacillus thermoaerophilus TaxID=143495 RepID=UPI002E231DEF|nr:hypothetical protein [Aneurinibacillus thermoaerophilus]MED0766374.1 hypothetical protein [Aneurinibacillus thermoaerophilus]